MPKTYHNSGAGFEGGAGTQKSERQTSGRMQFYQMLLWLLV
jgi:hypothetical protein